MKMVLGIAVAISVVAIMAVRRDESPTAEAVVAMPPAKLFASLDGLYSEIERKAANRTTVTGKPPVPVVFSFAREQDEMLAFEGKAGFRTVAITAWVEQGEQPDQSLLKVRFEPESLLEKSGHTSDPYRALRVTLERTSNQFVEGERITALFGGEPRSPSPEWDENEP